MSKAEFSSVPKEDIAEEVYFAEISRHPILTAKQTMVAFQHLGAEELPAKLVEDEDFMSDFASPNEERILEIVTNPQNRSIKDVLIACHQKLVVWVARRYDGMTLLDRVQEGNIGLMKAVDNFELERGVKFSTYAVICIRGAIMNARRKPAGSDEVFISSLNEPLADEGDELGEFIPSTAGTSLTWEVDDFVGALVDEDELKSKVLAALEQLDLRDEQILRMRFGLGGVEEKNQSEVSRELNLTRERVRQIEGKALENLKGNHRLRHLWERKLPLPAYAYGVAGERRAPSAEEVAFHMGLFKEEDGLLSAELERARREDKEKKSSTVNTVAITQNESAVLTDAERSERFQRLARKLPLGTECTESTDLDLSMDVLMGSEEPDLILADDETYALVKILLEEGDSLKGFGIKVNKKERELLELSLEKLNDVRQRDFWELREILARKLLAFVNEPLVVFRAQGESEDAQFALTFFSKLNSEEEVRAVLGLG